MDKQSSFDEAALGRLLKRLDFSALSQPHRDGLRRRVSEQAGALSDDELSVVAAGVKEFEDIPFDPDEGKRSENEKPGFRP